MMSAIFWLFGTLLVYWASKCLYRTYKKMYLTPLLVTPMIIITVIEWAGVSFNTYDKGVGWLTDLVEPATIALAVILYKNWDHLKKNAWAIIVCVGCGAIAAIVTSAGFSYLLGLSPEIMDSLAPRSATTPIAISISSNIGGIPTITAVATLFTGLLSLIVGPLIVKWFRIQHPLARGVLYGTSAHSAGISKAMEYDAVSGSIAAIAMMATAFITLIAAPWLVLMFQ
ncbi:CidB/LrgB family autolysis modulator [Paenibacillus sp. LMG 31456]|uniref:CidB/LrgB family autolysis modulator n=1 Tax=Paenibacillus foliorum TaxID=2654974 RepID=A0A972GW93_9BACL|nr:LrgB family protein [Paenibacillus foliorum]NOU98074.1 CidB/LrgB family autolysis modulator [Paenibacillus foliorum]